jgi:hypothetical protein
MMKLKRLLLSRKTITTEIVLILFVVLLGYIFPQRFSTTTADMEKWRDANPSLIPWVDRLGLDHVYTTPWFAMLLCFFLLSLVISTNEQIRKSLRKTFNCDDTETNRMPLLSVHEDRVISEIKNKGYIPLGKHDSLKRFVKHPWGYWGNTLLHLGLVIIIASSLIIVLTERRGVLYLVEKEIHFPGTPWTIVDTGVFAKDFTLPEAVRLEKINVEFWESDRLKHLSTDISFIDPQGRFKSYSPGINHIVKYRGFRIYQGTTFGHAFFVEFTDRQGKKEKLIFQIDHPSKRDRQSYEDFKDEAIPYPIRASYYVDAEKKSMKSNNPLLNLLIVEKDESVHEVSLRLGETGRLGPYTVRFVNVYPWAALIFVKSYGMYGIFTGFFVIMIGVFLTYFTPPREFISLASDKGVLIYWKPTNFERFYSHEYEEIISLSEEKNTK